MTKIIAFYLPQFHPIPENDNWYGKGFTEWRNVASAKKLYLGHYQPHIPSELGFYDLRLKDTVIKQANLAREYGVDGFCYWHYWFGNKKQLLEKPFNDLVNNKDINISFCVGWANDSWQKKQWNEKGRNELLIKQEYLGEKDYVEHFYSLLPAFKDKRYIKVGERLLFIIYKPLAFKKSKKMFEKWNELAKKEGLAGFYFVGHDMYCKHKKEIIDMGYQAIYNDNMLNVHHRLPKTIKMILKINRDFFHIPTVFKYKNAIKYMITKNEKESDVIPTIIPNWDHSPRSGKNNIMFKKCEPKYFKELAKNALLSVKNKKEDYKIIIIKSWNEWGEGNHMEPDLKYKRGYLEALKEAINEVEKI